MNEKLDMNEKLGLAQRDKYWTERNTDEKVAALYDEIMQLRYQMTEALSLLETLMVHSHADGAIVAPIDRKTKREYYIPVALQKNFDGVIK